MTAPAGIFCAHKRLRTACPECRPPPPPPPPPKAPKAPSATPKPASSASEPDDGSETDAPARRGPGKPLLPTRARRAKPPTRAEAEKAEAWWVKDR